MKQDALSTSEKLSSVLLLAFGMMSVARGTFWVIESNRAVNDSPFYHELNNIAPLYIWGAVLIFFGMLMCLSCYFVPKRLVGIKFDLFVMIGCTGSAVFFFFLTVVSMIDALNWLTPINFLIQTSCLGLCGFIGGVSYARKR